MRNPAQEAGSIRADEVALALGELELDAAQLDEVFGALEEANVDIVSGDDAEEEDESARSTQREVSTDALQLFLKDIGKVELRRHRRRSSWQSGSSAVTTARSGRWSRRIFASSSRSRRVPEPGPAVPRPDPGGRSGSCGRPRSSITGRASSSRPTQPGGSARRSRALADEAQDDPDAGPRGREAEQDRADGAQASRRAGSRTGLARDRGRARPDDRRGRPDPPERSEFPSRSRSPSATTRSRSSVTSSPTSRRRCPRRSPSDAPQGRARPHPPDAVHSRAARAQASLRIERGAATNARRGPGGRSMSRVSELSRSRNQCLKKLRAVAEANALRDVA